MDILFSAATALAGVTVIVTLRLIRARWMPGRSSLIIGCRAARAGCRAARV